MTDALAIDLDAPCWIFAGALNNRGYGSARYQGKPMGAHRYMWTVMRGPIPDGLCIDHLCRVRACVNPQHMEVVTTRENLLRGVGVSARAARATHCPQGHPYDEVNTIHRRGFRECHICKKVHLRKRWHELHPNAPYREYRWK